MSGFSIASDNPEGRPIVELSARNQLKGTVKNVKLGEVMAEVTIDVGGQPVTSAITKESAEHLKLKQGSPCMVIIKASEVMLATP